MAFDKNAQDIMNKNNPEAHIYITGHLSRIRIIPHAISTNFYEAIEGFNATKRDIIIFMNDGNICDERFYSFICIALIYIPEDKLSIYYNAQLLMTKGEQKDVQINATCPRGQLSCQSGRVKRWTFFTNDLEIINTELRKMQLRGNNKTITKFMKLVQFLTDVPLVLSDDIDNMQIEIIKKFGAINYSLIIDTSKISIETFMTFLPDDVFQNFLEICDKIGINTDLKSCTGFGIYCRSFMSNKIPAPYKLIGTPIEIRKTLAHELDVVQSLPIGEDLVNNIKNKDDVVQSLPIGEDLVNNIKNKDDVADHLATLNLDQDIYRRLLDVLRQQQHLGDNNQIEFIDEWLNGQDRRNLFQDDDDQFWDNDDQNGGGISYEMKGDIQYGAFIILLSAQLLQYYLEINKNINIKKKSLLLTGIQNFINKLLVLY